MHKPPDPGPEWPCWLVMRLVQIASGYKHDGGVWGFGDIRSDQLVALQQEIERLLDDA